MPTTDTPLTWSDEQGATFPVVDMVWWVSRELLQDEQARRLSVERVRYTAALLAGGPILSLRFRRHDRGPEYADDVRFVYAIIARVVRTVTP